MNEKRKKKTCIKTLRANSGFTECIICLSSSDVTVCYAMPAALLVVHVISDFLFKRYIQIIHSLLHCCLQNLSQEGVKIIFPNLSNLVLYNVKTLQSKS